MQEQECVQREPAVRAALSKMYRSSTNTGVMHDMKCTGAMHPLSSDVIKVRFPLQHGSALILLLHFICNGVYIGTYWRCIGT